MSPIVICSTVSKRGKSYKEFTWIVEAISICDHLKPAWPYFDVPDDTQITLFYMAAITEKQPFQKKKHLIPEFMPNVAGSDYSRASRRRTTVAGDRLRAFTCQAHLKSWSGPTPPLAVAHAGGRCCRHDKERGRRGCKIPRRFQGSQALGEEGAERQIRVGLVAARTCCLR